MKTVITFLLFLSVSAHGQTVSGEFTYVESIDPMTDADSSRIVTSVDDTSLLWQCVSNSLVMGASTGAFLSSAGDEVFVRYRFDKEPAESPQMWSVDASNTLAVAPFEFVPAINSRAIKAEQLAFEIVDYEGASHYATFTLKGFEDALQNLSCAN